MGLKWLLLSVLAFHWSSIASVAAGNKVVCYYGSWAVYRPGEGKFDVEDIDPNICTHINYGFVGINNDGSVRIMDSWNEVDKAALKRFSCLKKINPELKVFLAIGGWNEGSTKFSDVAKNSNLRAAFIKSAISLMKAYDYDGFDLDWEYPNQRGGIPDDIANFVQLLKEFRVEFDKLGYLLTAAVASAEFSVKLSYDIPQVAKYLDFINVMTYDLHGTWDGVTGHNSPLYASSKDVTAEQKQLNIDACIDFWIDSGAPPEKLILGIGLYGRTFTLANVNDNGIGAATYNGGTAGPYTRESGYLGYNEICVNLKQGGWTVVRDSEQQVPYAYKGNQWVGYDDPESIAIKAKYVQDRGLGGIMIWSFETDDFRGVCGRRNPLLNAIRTGLGLPTSDGNGWKSECVGQTNNGGGGTWTDPGNGGGAAPAPTDKCSKPGYARDATDCAVFYYCEVSGSSWTAHTFKCQSGLWFDVGVNACNWPQGECVPIVPEAPEPDETGPGTGGDDETDPGSDGDDKETDPGSPGGDNETDPGTGGDNETDPGTGGDNETDPGTGGDNETDPGSDGDDKETDPGTGGDTETDPGTGNGGGDTSPPASGEKCTKAGYARDAADCGVFYYCEVSGSTWKAHPFKCQAGLWFDLNLNVCNWPQSVNCVAIVPKVPEPDTDEKEPGTGGDNETDPGTGGDKETDPGTGGDKETDPGTGGDNETDPGSDGDDEGTDPGTGGDNEKEPGTGGDNETDPGNGGDTETDPGTGGGDSNESASDGDDTSDDELNNRVVCYYGSWAVYRPGDGKFDVEDIDPNICTHINYGFVGINSDGTVRIMDSWNEIDKAALTRFSGLKKQNPKLKVLFASGGWNEGSTKYSNVAKSPSLRATFIRSTVASIQTYGFDGLDLDWEYPNQRGGIPEDRENFITLLKEFRAEFDKYGYLLTAAVASAEASVSLSYIIPQVSKYLDFINVMTYDLHGTWDGVTGHNSPLYASSKDTNATQRQLNVDACINYWLANGAAPEKLVLGIGLYGRTFTLANANNNGIGELAYNGGTAGPYTRESGYLGYNEICVNIQEGGWTVVRDQEQQVPYAYKGNQWVGYDDPTSIALKADFVRRKRLGGIMIWSFETDDFRAKCGPRNPLLNAIRTGLGLKPSSGNGWGPGGAPPSASEVCTKTGYVRDPKNCAVFYYCSGGAGSWTMSTSTCPGGLYFDTNSGGCNWPAQVSCP